RGRTNDIAARAIAAEEPDGSRAAKMARRGYNPRPMRKYFPDLPSFTAAAKSAEVVPVYRQLLADRLTPVTAFELLGRDAHAFLLESVIGNEKIGRYSFIATSP